MPRLSKNRKRLKKRICKEFINKLQIHEAGETYCRPEVELNGAKVQLDASYLSEDKLSMTSSDIVKYWVKNSPILPNYYNSHRLKDSPSTSTEAVRSAVSRISLQSADEPTCRFHSNDASTLFPSAGVRQKTTIPHRFGKQMTKPYNLIPRSFTVNANNRSATSKRVSLLLVALISVLALVVTWLLGSSFNLSESLRWATTVVIGYFASMFVAETILLFAAAVVCFCSGSLLDDADWFPPISTLDDYHSESKSEKNFSTTEKTNLKIASFFSMCKNTISRSKV